MKIVRRARVPGWFAAAGVLMALGAASPTAAQDGDQTVSPDPVAPEAAQKPSTQALAAWRGKVLAHLSSHKRQVANSPGGISTVAFSIDRSGTVLTAQIVKSSGSTTLDNEAVALTKRASPVPAPPADLTGNKLYLKVPIQFAR